MRNYRQSFPSKYLKESDLNGKPLVVTIKGAEDELVESRDGSDMCLVARFHDHPKPLILNKTNSDSIAEIAGSPDMDEWPDTRIELFPTTCEVRGKVTPCVRVRAPQSVPDSAAAEVPF